MSESAARLNVLSRFHRRLGERAEDLLQEATPQALVAAVAVESVRLALQDTVRDLENEALIQDNLGVDPRVAAVVLQAIVPDPPQTAQEDVRDEAHK